MGFFSKKKTISVASSVYNLAGDEADRVSYIKSTIFSTIMSPGNQYLGEAIVNNLLSGPGIRQRSFMNWAKRNNAAGLPDLSVQRALPVDPHVVKPHIPIPADPAGMEVQMGQATLSDGDFTYFVEEWILENEPDKFNTDYSSEYDLDNHEFIIQYDDASTDVVPAGSYDANKKYVVAYFKHTLPSETQDLETGTLVEDVDFASLPDTTGYSSDSISNTGIESFILSYDETVTKTYSDSTPQDGPTTTSEIDLEDFNGIEEVFSNTVYAGNGDTGDAQTKNVETFIHIFERRHEVDRISTTTEYNDIGGGVTETVVTERDGDHLDPIYDYRIDTQDTINGKVVGGQQIFIYEIGTGNATLDALAEEDASAASSAEFYPFIPVRLNNVSIFDEDFDDDTGNGLYEESKAAYKRASSGNSFDELVEQVEDNEDLGDIDYCYIAYGASLNTTENAGLKYIYSFLEGMIPYQNTNGTYMAGFISDVATYDADVADYDEWVAAQSDSSHPRYNTTAPPVPQLVEPETTTLNLKSADARLPNFDNRITWVSIDEEFFSGEGKPGATTGEVWIEKDGTFEWDEVVNGSTTPHEIEKTLVFWQTSDTTYKRLTVYGLTHRNFIYQGKYVHISFHEALDDDETSGFLIPLHDPTLRAMSLVDSTQLALSNTFLIFNSYKVTVQRWYQRFLGMLLIIVLVLVVSVLINPAAMSGASGLFGANAAVGASLGFSGTAAILAGAVSNALAAIVLTGVVTEVTTNVFGEKWGSIIGAIISFAITFGASGGFNNFNMTTAMTPKNLLAMSSALANGYNGFVQADIADLNEQLEVLGQENKEEMDKIAEMIAELGGNNGLSFDPMQLTDVSAGNGSGTGSYVPESLDEFIHRTTMTGSEVVDITLTMVSDFAELNLQLPT